MLCDGVQSLQKFAFITRLFLGKPFVILKLCIVHNKDVLFVCLARFFFNGMVSCGAPSPTTKTCELFLVAKSCPLIYSLIYVLAINQWTPHPCNRQKISINLTYLPDLSLGIQLQNTDICFSRKGERGPSEQLENNTYHIEIPQR
jgi:hypothetical protein